MRRRLDAHAHDIEVALPPILQLQKILAADEELVIDRMSGPSMETLEVFYHGVGLVESTFRQPAALVVAGASRGLLVDPARSSLISAAARPRAWRR